MNIESRRTKEVRLKGTFEDWQKQARELLHQQIAPEQIVWVEDTGQQSLLADPNNPDNPPKSETPLTMPAFRVPKRFIELAKNVAAFRDDKKWPLLYSLLWRIAYENHDLLKIETDNEVIQLLRMDDAVSRDVHHLHAFVRFKKVVTASGEQYVAWYKPDHKSLRLAAPFFAARFPSMHWSILTPDESAHWDGRALTFSAGEKNPPSNDADGLERLWAKYYATTFNPARTNVRMMRSEVPMRFWKQMPEMNDLPQILTRAPERVSAMIAVQRQVRGGRAFLPPKEQASLNELRQAIQSCEGCELHRKATQAAFGEGPVNAMVVLVGEQPGDQEDRIGRPFVGPAGEVLDRALQESGIDRASIYLTNVVKHFAFDERGKRRIHRTPRLSEVTACRPWMEAELNKIGPKIVVCLGATAAKAIFGVQFRLTEQRGTFLESRWAQKTIATYHPSAVLRAHSQESQDRLYGLLVADLTIVAAQNRAMWELSAVSKAL